MSVGYDTSCTTLSPEGRIYQLEYSRKAIENSPSVVGIIFKDGILLISEKIKKSKSIVSGSNHTIYSIAPHIGMAICGFLPDGRNIISRAKLESSNYLKNFGLPISGQILAERLSLYIHSHTCHWGARPFGCSVLIGSFDNDSNYHLYMIGNDGNFFEYMACVDGKGKQIIKANLERDNFQIRNYNIKEGIKRCLKILVKNYEGGKENEYDIGMISNETNNLFQIINYNLVQEETKKIRNEIEEEIQN